MKKKVFCLIIPLAFFFVYLSLCFNNNIWTDEAFTIELLREDIPGIIRGTAGDVHPPLYYIIAKLWEYIFGDSLLSLKLISILPMVLTMAVGGWILAGDSLCSCWLFQLFLGVIPCTMEYAVQPRMYSWAIFFVTLMGLLSMEIFSGEEKNTANLLLLSVIIGIMGAAAALTHYFAFAAALWIYGFLFLALCIYRRERLKYWLLSCLLSLILFLPWYPYMRLQVLGVSRNYWIEEITEKTVALFLPFLFGLEIPYSEWIWTLFILTAALICVKKRRWGGLLAMAVPLVVLLTGVVISSLMRPIFIVRYILPCMGLLALGLALAFGALLKGDRPLSGAGDRSLSYVGDRPLSGVGDRSLSCVGDRPLSGAGDRSFCFAGERLSKRAAILLAGLILFCLGNLACDYKQSRYKEYLWTHTAETEAFLAEHVGDRDIISYNYDSYKFVYDYYWTDEEKVLWGEIDLEDCPYENIWLLDTIYFPYPTEEYLNSLGWTKEYMGNYGIEHNNFKIYKLHRL